MTTTRIILQILITAVLLIIWQFTKTIMHNGPTWEMYVVFYLLLLLIWVLPYMVINRKRIFKKKNAPGPGAVERPAEETPAPPGGTNDN